MEKLLSSFQEHPSKFLDLHSHFQGMNNGNRLHKVLQPVLKMIEIKLIYTEFFRKRHQGPVVYQARLAKTAVKRKINISVKY